MRGVVGWLRPGSQFAFQYQVHQMHRMHRTQGIIFADVWVLGFLVGGGGWGSACCPLALVMEVMMRFSISIIVFCMLSSRTAM